MQHSRKMGLLRLCEFSEVTLRLHINVKLLHDNLHQQLTMIDACNTMQSRIDIDSISEKLKITFNNENNGRNIKGQNENHE